MVRPTKAQCAAIAKRRADAIDLKLAGVDWLILGRKLAADPAVNSAASPTRRASTTPWLLCRAAR